jgi:hypothetical protein
VVGVWRVAGAPQHVLLVRLSSVQRSDAKLYCIDGSCSYLRATIVSVYGFMPAAVAAVAADQMVLVASLMHSCCAGDLSNDDPRCSSSGSTDDLVWLNPKLVFCCCFA